MQLTRGARARAAALTAAATRLGSDVLRPTDEAARREVSALPAMRDRRWLSRLLSGTPRALVASQYRALLVREFDAGFVRVSSPSQRVVDAMKRCRDLIVRDSGSLAMNNLFREGVPTALRPIMRRFVLTRGDPTCFDELRKDPRSLVSAMRLLPRFVLTPVLENCAAPPGAVEGTPLPTSPPSRRVRILDEGRLREWYDSLRARPGFDMFDILLRLAARHIDAQTHAAAHLGAQADPNLSDGVLHKTRARRQSL